MAVVIDATVREWHDELGWGVVDTAETPGGCWVHYSHVDSRGYRTLSDVAQVRLEYEQAEQDGYRFRAVRVEIPGRLPADRDEQAPSAAYQSTLHIEIDD